MGQTHVLGRRSYDDRDHFGDKNLETPGSLVASLFAQNFSKNFVKTFDKEMRKELNYPPHLPSFVIPLSSDSVDPCDTSLFSVHIWLLWGRHVLVMKCVTLGILAGLPSETRRSLVATCQNLKSTTISIIPARHVHQYCSGVGMCWWRSG